MIPVMTTIPNCIAETAARSSSVPRWRSRTNNMPNSMINVMAAIGTLMERIHSASSSMRVSGR